MVRKEKTEDIKHTDAWLFSSVEVAEFCSKVMDWKLKSGNTMAEQVSQAYLIYMEEVFLELEKHLEITQSDSFHQEYALKAQDYHKKMQHMLSELYKRLMDEKVIMGINTEDNYL